MVLDVSILRTQLRKRRKTTRTRYPSSDILYLLSPILLEYQLYFNIQRTEKYSIAKVLGIPHAMSITGTMYHGVVVGYPKAGIFSSVIANWLSPNFDPCGCHPRFSLA